MKFFASLLFIFSTLLSFSQKSYDFDIPLRAKSNEGIYDLFIEKLNPTCDSLVNEMFNQIGVNTDSIQWMYPTDLFYVCHEKGWDYYSRRMYFADEANKTISCYQKNTSENQLPNSLFNLSYFYNNGITSLVLIEYY